MFHQSLSVVVRADYSVFSFNCSLAGFSVRVARNIAARNEGSRDFGGGMRHSIAVPQMMSLFRIVSKGAVELCAAMYLVSARVSTAGAVV